MADVADTGSDESQDTGAAFVADETEFNIFNTDQKLAAVEETVKKLATLPEKKALVYITGGISKTGIDNQAVLDQALEAARTFRPLSSAQVASLLERTKPVAQEGRFELYKTSSHFDGTAHRPEMLG